MLYAGDELERQAVEDGDAIAIELEQYSCVRPAASEATKQGHDEQHSDNVPDLARKLYHTPVALVQAALSLNKLYTNCLAHARRGVCGLADISQSSLVSAGNSCGCVHISAGCVKISAGCLLDAEP